MKIRFLALDIATKTGFATDNTSGTVDFSVKRGESPGMRLVKFRKWLSDLVEKEKPDIIIYEQAHHRGGAATAVCVGLAALAQEVATSHGIEYGTVHTATLKLYATGHGKASKEMMITAAKNFYPDTKIVDDNHADALLILKWAKENYETT